MKKLYVLRGCPYCKKVIEANQNSIGIDLCLKYIEDKKNHSALLKKGGEIQAPFLLDEDNKVSMYESDDIIAYLENLKKKS